MIPLLGNNPFFLKNMRQRLRLPMLVSSAIFLICILFLIMLNSSVHRDSLTASYRENLIRTTFPVPWMRHAFWNITITQGIIILVLGTFRTFQATREEKISDTLDLHRSSPTDRREQILGLIAGGPILEWILFLLAMPLSILLAVFSGIHLGSLTSFYAGLILSSILCHAFAVLVGLRASKNITAQNGGLSFVLLLLIFSRLWSFFVLPTFYHLTVLPSYHNLYKHVILQDKTSFDTWNEIGMLLGLFSAWSIPTIVLQIFLQLPVLLLLSSLIARSIGFPWRRALSKKQILLTAFLWLTYLLLGLLSYPAPGGQTKEIPPLYWFFLLQWICYGIGIVGALFATPSHLEHTKFLRRMNKTQTLHPSIWDDYASNSFWLILTCGMIIGTWLSYAMIFTESVPFVYISILLCHVIFFACAWESFLLGPWRLKKAFFWTGIGILWILIPIAGMILFPPTMTGQLTHSALSFVSVSPLFSFAWSLEKSNRFSSSLFSMATLPVLLPNILLAATALYVSIRQRQKIQSQLVQGHCETPV